MKKWSKSILTGLMAAMTLFSCLPEMAFRTARAFATENIPEGARTDKTLYENVAGESISAWTTEGVKIGWEYESATAEVEVSSGQGVRVKALDGAKAVALPIGAETDFVYSATVRTASNGGEFGLLTDLKNDATQSDGATYYGVRIGDESDYGVYTYIRANDEYYDQTYANPVRTFGTSVSRGDVCTLTVYNLLGRTYFYINGGFVAMRDIQFFSEEDCDTFGFYTSGADVTITSVSVKTLVGVTDAFTLENPIVRYADKDGYTNGKGSFGLRYCATIDKTSNVYKNAVGTGEFDVTDPDVRFGMLLLPNEYLQENEALTKDTPMVLDVPMETVLSQTNGVLRFTVSLLDIPQENFNQDLTARVYMKVKNGDGWEYTYSRDSKSRDLINATNLYYEDVENAKIRARLDNLFDGYEGYYGKNAKRVKFSIFADFHYEENKYMSSVDDLDKMMRRAKSEDVDFLLQMGDFSNKFKNSPEIVNAYLNNEYDFSVYGIYGNHELEGKEEMSFVTNRLTNRKDEVVWGTSDGKIGDGHIGYYYFDYNGLRIICMDSNYGWHSGWKKWVHREALTFASYGKDENGNRWVEEKTYFGQPQINWLKSVLSDAAAKDISCIVLSHHALSGLRVQHPRDSEAVRAAFNEANRRRAGTVLMVMNGHLHTDSILFRDDILYFDVNTVRNGTYWNYTESGETGYDYGDMTFNKVSYDDDGNVQGTSSILVNNLTGSDETWFFADPLSAIVSVSSSGYIRIEGMQTTWFAGSEPINEVDSRFVHPWISSGVFDVPVN